MEHLQDKHADLPRRSLRTLTRGIASAIAFAGFVLIALIAIIGWKSNSYELAAERARIENALSQTVERTLEQQKTIAWWDDAVKNIQNNFDSAFADANFGYYFSETFGHDEVYILDSDDKPIYAFLDGKSWDASYFNRRSADLRSVVEAARGRTQSTGTDRTVGFAAKQERYSFLKGALRSAKWGAKITLIDKKPAIIAATTIVPNIDLSLLKGLPYLLVTIIDIDADFTDSVGGSLLISNLRFSDTDMSGGTTVSDRFVTDDGQSGGFLSWTTSQPGQPLLTIILPLVLVGVAGMWVLSAKMLKRLTAVSTELAQNEATARHDARHDALSGLPNRVYFVDTITEYLCRQTSQPEAENVVIGFLDVDRFKEVNDTLGHQSGDELIRQVARRLQKTLGDDCIVARFGGDEFAIFQRVVKHDDMPSMEKLVATAFRDPFAVQGSPIRVTASLGLARYPEDGPDPDDLMRNADIALYVAKRQGRDQAVLFDAGMASELAINRQIELDLRDALVNGELDLHFQPLIAAQNGKLTGAEALLRWFHPTKGSISPSTFIPIAEECGMMMELGEWVLRRAVESATQWGDLEIAVNLSPVQFKQSNLASLLETMVENAGVEPSRITLEVTEGVLLESSFDVKKTLEDLRKAGFRIALDDFGTGFSSLKYLVDFRFDKLKIDRSFVNKVSYDGSAGTIVRSIVHLSQALGMEVVAEGVETSFAATTMQALGCHQLQGYFFSKPLSAADFELFVASYDTERHIPFETTTNEFHSQRENSARAM